MKDCKQTTLGSPRGFFLIFCSLFLIGDIIWWTWWKIDILISIVFLLFFALSHSWRYLAFFGIFGLLLGGVLGNSAIEKKMNEYVLLSKITNGFSLKQHNEGIVEKRVYKKDRSDVYRLHIDTIDTHSTSIFVEIPSNLHINIGDTLGFTGTIKKNINFPLIGYDRFSFFQGWYGQIFLASFDRTEGIERSWITPVQKYWEGVFGKYFPPDVWGTLLGMTIGSVELLSRDIKDAFIASGTSHILVVSGSNIAFLIILLSFFLKYTLLGRTSRILIISSVVWFYGFLVGWDISVIRATIMGVLSYIITEYGSHGSSRAILWLSLLILTIISPLGPIYDPGFWLSFSATLGILLFHTKIAALCDRISLPHSMTSMLSITFGATLGSLPVLIFHFGTFALSSILANILIAGILWWILFSSVFFVGIQYISHTLWYLFWFLVYIPTKIIIGITAFFRYGIILEVPIALRTPIALFVFGIYFFFYLEEDVFQKKEKKD